MFQTELREIITYKILVYRTPLIWKLGIEQAKLENPASVWAWAKASLHEPAFV